jgi:hypothetical protein
LLASLTKKLGLFFSEAKKKAFIQIVPIWILKNSLKKKEPKRDQIKQRKKELERMIFKNQ